MRSSRTLLDRNTDPEAFFAGAAPAPEFQHGVLPENPILVEFREGVESGDYETMWLARHWRELLVQGYDFSADAGEYLQADRCHATRVLTLLTKIGETND